MPDSSGVDPELLGLVSAAVLSGAICLWLRKDDEQEANTFRARGVRTIGTVVGHEIRSVVEDAESSRRVNRFSPVVEFTDREGNVVKFVSTLMTHFSDVPVRTQVAVVYLPEAPKKAEMVDALGNPSAGQLDGSGQFVRSSGGYCGLFFGLFMFLCIPCMMIVSLLF
ncbi:DUF3592 domain-containing protein [Streptomyces buecherae]|uniref:DUF3592 domain-containing protein n=1 Tax=Streptomyces buecherae TaxID=2763006 RepID=UPI0037A391C1